MPGALPSRCIDANDKTTDEQLLTAAWTWQLHRSAVWADSGRTKYKVARCKCPITDAGQSMSQGSTWVASTPPMMGMLISMSTMSKGDPWGSWLVCTACTEQASKEEFRVRGDFIMVLVLGLRSKASSCSPASSTACLLRCTYLSQSGPTPLHPKIERLVMDTTAPLIRPAST